jgi:CubicO group peptidase (beta-lactamase class C family)
MPTVEITLENGCQIYGYVANGFEKVYDTFLHNFSHRGEIGASCVVFHRDTVVVSLHGGWAEKPSKKNDSKGRLWTNDTLVNVHSCSKGVANGVLGMLVDRDCMSYASRVSNVLGGFESNGKSDVRIEQLLSHQVGLAYFDEPLQLKRMRAAQAGDVSESKRLYETIVHAKPKWMPGDNRFGYHALTIGLYVSALASAVDTEHRSLREIMHTDVLPQIQTQQARSAEFYFGISDAQSKELKPRIARLYSIFPQPDDESEDEKDIKAHIFDPESDGNRAFLAIANFSAWKAQDLELPSAVGFTNAHTLAAIYNHLLASFRPSSSSSSSSSTATAAATIVQSTEPLIRNKTVAETMTEPFVHGRDLVLNHDIGFTRGGFMHDERFPGAFFHGGYGGSMGWADKNLDIAFAYTPNALRMTTLSDTCTALLISVYKSMAALKYTQQPSSKL